MWPDINYPGALSWHLIFLPDIDYFVLISIIYILSKYWLVLILTILTWYRLLSPDNDYTFIWSDIDYFHLISTTFTWYWLICPEIAYLNLISTVLSWYLTLCPYIDFSAWMCYLGCFSLSCWLFLSLLACPLDKWKKKR